MVGLAAPAMAAGPVPNTQFGMHIPEISLGVDPGVSYGAIRLWDSGISWGKVQQSKGTFWWTGMDQAIGNANTQNVKILYVLGSTPTWAASNKKQGTYPNKGAASMPTMAAAVGYDLLKNRDVLDFSAWSQIALGFALAFITGVIVVKWLLSYIGRHGYALFGWWRIIVGSLALIALSLGF
jgi:hypothetical protein